MTNRLTLAQAQDRLIKRVVEAHQGHQKRVLAAARKQLFAWAIAGGYTQDEAIVVCNDACDMLSLALKEKGYDAANVEQTAEQKTAVQTTTQQNTTETTKENDMAAVTKPQQKTYTIAQKVTGNEVEVMSLVQLQELVKARIAEGEDPQTVVGFVGLEYEGDMYYGITSELNGTASALEDGLDIRFWWEDEYNEIGFKWLWEEPSANEITVTEQRSAAQSFPWEELEAEYHARNSQKENSNEDDSERSSAKTVIEEIHGLKVSISCSQGWISEEDRDNRIENVVSTCKDMQKEEFVSAMKDRETGDWGGELYQKLLFKLDEIISEGYVKQREDDFPPIVSVKLA